MTTTTTTTASGWSSLAAGAALTVGGLAVAYGLLLVPASLLGGLHIAAFGLSLALSGLFLTEWSGARFGLSAEARRRLSFTFAGLAALLLATFIAVNFASFGSFEATGGEVGGSG